MEENNSPKTTTMAGYIDIFLVILGQALIVFIIFDEGLYGYMIALALALNATGLGIRAKKGGRSVVTWVLIGCLFPLIIPVIVILFMVFRDRKGSREKRPLPLYGHVIMAAILFLIGGFTDGLIQFCLFCHNLGDRLGVGRKARLIYEETTAFPGYDLPRGICDGPRGRRAVNNGVSERNAAVIIAACDEYLKKNGAYPESLNGPCPRISAEGPGRALHVDIREFPVSQGPRGIGKQVFSHVYRRSAFCQASIQFRTKKHGAALIERDGTARARFAGFDA